MSALSTLYGAVDQSATVLADNIGGLAREQEAWTPDWILAAARAAMGGIQLDPCGASRYDSEVTLRKTKNRPERVNQITGGWFADVTLVKPGSHEGLKASPHGGTVISLDGLATDWSDAASVYVNPEYVALEVWLRKCAKTGARGTKVVCLCPVRTHRSWWLPLARTGQIVCLGYAVKFKGHLDACPFPLCLISWNCTIPDLGKMETGRI